MPKHESSRDRSQSRRRPLSKQRKSRRKCTTCGKFFCFTITVAIALLIGGWQNMNDDRPMCAFDFFPFTICYGENGCCGDPEEYGSEESESGSGSEESDKKKKKKKKKSKGVSKDNSFGDNAGAVWDGGKNLLKSAAGGLEDALGGSDEE